MKVQVLLYLSLVISPGLFGQCISGDCQNGIGILLLENGERYAGQFSQGKAHGIGSWYYQDGSLYTGNWKNGLRDGEGVLRSASGKERPTTWRLGHMLLCARNLPALRHARHLVRLLAPHIAVHQGDPAQLPASSHACARAASGRRRVQLAELALGNTPPDPARYPTAHRHAAGVCRDGGRARLLPMVAHGRVGRLRPHREDVGARGVRSKARDRLLARAADTDKEGVATWHAHQPVDAH